MAVGDLARNSRGQWITHPPSRCPNGHSLGPGGVLVGHQACLDRNAERAGIKRHFPNLTQIPVNAAIGFAVADFCEQNAGKLGKTGVVAATSLLP